MIRADRGATIAKVLALTVWTCCAHSTPAGLEEHLAFTTVDDSSTPRRFNALWRHDWSNLTSQLWVDFFGHSHKTMPTDDQWDFIAAHYAIVSLEKCFAEATFPFTEDAVHAAAVALKTRRPGIKVLYYQNSMMAFPKCYAAGKTFLDHPEWWLRDDAGTPYKNGADIYYFDVTKEPVRNYVARSATLGVANHTDLLDGVFADSAGDMTFSNMNKARTNLYNAWHHASLNETRRWVAAGMRPDSLVLANGLAAGRASGSDGLDILGDVDGGCFEHFLSFEMIDSNNGSLVPALYLEAIRVIETATARGKIVLVRGWPGPAVEPLTPLGPSWPSGSPGNRTERARAAAEWLIPSLSAYLILASETTYFSYNWWYGVADGVYPCPEDPGSCSAPRDWFPDLLKGTGRPLGRFVRRPDSWVFVRHFENATVIFDAANVNQSRIHWR